MVYCSNFDIAFLISLIYVTKYPLISCLKMGSQTNTILNVIVNAFFELAI